MAKLKMLDRYKYNRYIVGTKSEDANGLGAKSIKDFEDEALEIMVEQFALETDTNVNDYVAYITGDTDVIVLKHEDSDTTLVLELDTDDCIEIKNVEDSIELEVKNFKLGSMEVFRICGDILENEDIISILLDKYKGKIVALSVDNDNEAYGIEELEDLESVAVCKCERITTAGITL
jgi:hypothetical protein